MVVVELFWLYCWEVVVLDEGVDFGQWYVCFGVVVIEEVEFDVFGIFVEEGEVGVLIVEGCFEWVGGFWLDFVVYLVRVWLWELVVMVLMIFIVWLKLQICVILMVCGQGWFRQQMNSGGMMLMYLMGMLWFMMQ